MRPHPTPHTGGGLSVLCSVTCHWLAARGVRTVRRKNVRVCLYRVYGPSQDCQILSHFYQIRYFVFKNPPVLKTIQYITMTILKLADIEGVTHVTKKILLYVTTK